MDQEKIGKYIKKKRMELGISQNELGDKVHVTRQAVSNWENGKTIPDPDILKTLSSLFQVSINNILDGGEEKDLETITMDLLKENSKKDHKIKRNFILSTIIFISLSTLFLTYYFISNYNSINVYKTTGLSKNFRVRDGIIISTSKNTYFKLGSLEVKNKSSDIVINRIKLFMKKDKKEVIIYESDVEDRLFVNNNGYNELYKKEFKKNKNNFYLEITYNSNEKEIIKLELEEEFKNDYIMLLEKSNIVKNKLIEESESNIQYAFEQEEKEFERNNKIRNSETLEENKEPVFNLKQDIIEEPIEEKEDTTEENIKILENENIEDQEENNDNQEEQLPNINYEEIISIIEKYGTYESNSYQLSYVFDDNTYVCIGIYYGKIKLDINTGRVNETITYKNGLINYNEMIDYNIVTRCIFNIHEEIDENKKEIINRMNDYLLLVYQEIEREQF